MRNNLLPLHDCICIKLMEPYTLVYLKYQMNFMVSIFLLLPNLSVSSNLFYQILDFQVLRLDVLSHYYVKNLTIVQYRQQRILNKMKFTGLFLIKLTIFDKMKSQITTRDQIHYQVHILSVLKCIISVYYEIIM